MVDLPTRIQTSLVHRLSSSLDMDKAIVLPARRFSTSDTKPFDETICLWKEEACSCNLWARDLEGKSANAETPLQV